MNSDRAWVPVKEKTPPQNEALIVCYVEATRQSFFLGYYGRDGWNISASQEIRPWLGTPDFWMSIPLLLEKDVDRHE